MRREFDADFYLDRYPEVRNFTQGALAHYIAVGWKEGCDPSPQFSTHYYLSGNPDVREAGINPFYHYLRWGRKEGRRAVSVASANTASQEGDKKVRATIKEQFDSDFYLARYPEVKKAREDALGHYVAVGWKEGRDPTPEFSTKYYLTSNSDVREAGINPFYHYLVQGRQEGRRGAPGGGFRARALEHLKTLESTVRDWSYPTRRRPPQLMSSRYLARRLEQLVGSSCPPLVVSLTHDDYTSVPGGVQRCVVAEQNAVQSGGGVYVSVHPVQPLPILSREVSANDLVVSVLWNGELVGTVKCSDLIGALKTVSSRMGMVSLVIHALHGHSPEVVAELYEALEVEDAYFWLHDYFSICPGYRLLRNEIFFCGAPAIDSAACAICIFGEERKFHIKRFSVLFNRVPFKLVSPSSFALDLWKNASTLPCSESLVHPHCKLKLSNHSSVKLWRDDGPIRVAFLGTPTLHKGWPVFRDLALRFRSNPAFEFCHLASERGENSDIEFFPLEETANRGSDMTRAMVHNRIDIAFLWSICPETFSLVTYEALAAGALIITCEDAGNIPLVVRKLDRGIVFSGESELLKAFQDDSLNVFARTQKARGIAGGDLEFSNVTADLLHTKVRKKSCQHIVSQVSR